jgi:hypothetical protein
MHPPVSACSGRAIATRDSRRRRWIRRIMKDPTVSKLITVSYLSLECQSLEGKRQPGGKRRRFGVVRHDRYCGIVPGFWVASNGHVGVPVPIIWMSMFEVAVGVELGVVHQTDPVLSIAMPLVEELSG